MIIVGLSVAGLLPGLESTIVTTYLPTITAELSIGDNYVWIANVFSLTRWDGFSNLKRPVRQVVNKLHLTRFCLPSQRCRPTPLWSSRQHFWQKMARNLLCRVFCFR